MYTILTLFYVYMHMLGLSALMAIPKLLCDPCRLVGTMVYYVLLRGRLVKSMKKIYSHMHKKAQR